MRGRKPLPNVLKLLRASRRPLNPDEPTPPPAASDPPRGLDRAAAAVWNEVVPELGRLGLFTVVDVGRVARTCRLEALGRSLLRGQPDRTRLLMAARAFDLADRVWSAFGVAAPGERARLRTPAREEDALAAFRKKHGA